MIQNKNCSVSFFRTGLWCETEARSGRGDEIAHSGPASHEREAR